MSDGTREPKHPYVGEKPEIDELEEARIFDTTLRDGEQTPGVSFDYDEKREIASILDDMDTDIVEAGFPASSEAEFEVVSDIAASASSTTCAMARAVESDVEEALDAGVDMVLTFVSTSDVQLADSMDTSREDAKQRAVDAVRRLDEAGVEVMFGPMDATRTEESYLFEVIDAVTDAGADWIVIPDTCGVTTPQRFYGLISRITDRTDANIDVHTQDDFGLAVANAIAGLRAGAAQAQVTVNGIGERGGNAAYEEVVMALESLYDVDTDIDTHGIKDVSSYIAEASDIDVPPNKPVVGSNAFSHESGIHAAGVIENPDTFEPGVMTPDMIGSERKLVLGKHTGEHSVRKRLEDAGYDPSDKMVRTVTRKVKEYAAEKNRILEKDLERFARESDIPQSDPITNDD